MPKEPKWQSDEEISYIVIGRNAQEIRQKNNLRQADVAGALGISLTHYSNCERGKRKMGLHIMAQFCKLTHETLESLLEGALDEVEIRQNVRSDAEKCEKREDEIWLRKMEQYQRGCSAGAKQLMLEMCSGISALDKGLDKKG